VAVKVTDYKVHCQTPLPVTEIGQLDNSQIRQLTERQLTLQTGQLMDYAS